MIIDCISDLHGFFPELEGGDLLIIAGDLTKHDTVEEHLEFIKWMSAAKYKKIVFLAGNHDNALANYEKTKEIYLHKDFSPSRWADEIVYLMDSCTEFEGLKIWGSPWTKSFPGMNPNCKAFTLETEEQLAKKWKLIPDDIDILVTHSPPYGTKDWVKNFYTGKIESVGSGSLAIAIMDRPTVKVCIFGHIHESYGIKDNRPDGRILINASHVNEYYEPVNKPIRVIL